jgi:mannose-6-phosphate isomerase-like protein (cupin superfamily)
MRTLSAEGTRGTTIELVHEGSDMHVQRSTIQAGGAIPNHQHDVPSSYVIVTGSGRSTGHHARDVKQGDTVLIPAGEHHGWESTGSETLVVVGTFSGPAKH